MEKGSGACIAACPEQACTEAEEVLIEKTDGTEAEEETEGIVGMADIVIAGDLTGKAVKEDEGLAEAAGKEKGLMETAGEDSTEAVEEGLAEAIGKEEGLTEAVDQDSTEAAGITEEGSTNRCCIAKRKIECFCSP